MSPSCNNCGGHVSERYHRVRCGNDGKLHACPECTDERLNQRQAAGIAESERKARSTKAGNTTPVGDSR